MVENNVVGNAQGPTGVCLVVAVVAVENDVFEVGRQLRRNQPLLGVIPPFFVVVQGQIVLLHHLRVGEDRRDGRDVVAWRAGAVFLLVVVPGVTVAHVVVVLGQPKLRVHCPQGRPGLAVGVSVQVVFRWEDFQVVDEMSRVVCGRRNEVGALHLVVHDKLEPVCSGRQGYLDLERPVLGVRSIQCNHLPPSCERTHHKDLFTPLGPFENGWYQDGLLLLLWLLLLLLAEIWGLSNIRWFIHHHIFGSALFVHVVV